MPLVLVGDHRPRGGARARQRRPATRFPASSNGRGGSSRTAKRCAGAARARGRRAARRRPRPGGAHRPAHRGRPPGPQPRRADRRRRRVGGPPHPPRGRRLRRPQARRLRDRPRPHDPHRSRRARAPTVGRRRRRAGRDRRGRGRRLFRPGSGLDLVATVSATGAHSSLPSPPSRREPRRPRLRVEATVEADELCRERLARS